MAWRTVPCCERCWIEGEGEWDLETVGDITYQRLISLRQPHLIRTEQIEVETCYACGWPTFIGLFVRRDVMVDGNDEVVPEAIQDGRALPPSALPPEVSA